MTVARQRERADEAEERRQTAAEDRGKCHGGQQQEGRDRGPALAAQPACPPLGEGPERPLRIAEMEGGGQKPDHRQPVAQPPDQERLQPVDREKPEGEEGQEPETGARQCCEDNDGRCWMH